MEQVEDEEQMHTFTGPQTQKVKAKWMNSSHEKHMLECFVDVVSK